MIEDYIDLVIEPCASCGVVEKIGNVGGKPTIGHACEWELNVPKTPWWQGSPEEWNRRQIQLREELVSRDENG